MRRLAKGVDGVFGGFARIVGTLKIPLLKRCRMPGQKGRKYRIRDERSTAAIRTVFQWSFISGSFFSGPLYGAFRFGTTARNQHVGVVKLFRRLIFG